MGKYTPKPYKKKCRLTGQWIVVTPEPIEFNESKKYSQRHEIMQIRINERNLKNQSY